MVLTPDQVQEILNIISYHQIHFIAEHVGTDVLTSSDIELLEQFGIDLKELGHVGKVEDAFKFGKLSVVLNESQNQKLSYAQFKKFLKSGKGIPLSIQEKFALKNVKYRAYSDIKGLGNKISQDFQNTLIEASKKQRKQFEKIIRETSKETILSRGSVQSMVSDLGHKTNDWARDFGRISDFILHDAFDSGRAESIREEFGDDSEVYKQVYPGACQHCIRLYLTSGIGSEPQVFNVVSLIQNGTNIGVKTADWKPVIGSTHPWCRCTLFRKPKGYSWSNETQSFSVPTGERKVQRKSKVRVKFGDKNFEV